MRKHGGAIVRAVQGEVVRALARAGYRPGDPLAVACSHGPDSLALADAVLCARRLLGNPDVTLVYIDHGLRAEARAEGAAVARLAAEHTAACRIAKVAVDPRDGGLEAGARRARYAALDRVREEIGASFVLVGHTASDQAETVLGRLLRGAGVVGLAGIPARRGAYLRPFLNLDRTQIVAYLAKRDLTASHDRSNDDARMLRNRIRHRHLPALRAENPRLDAALNRTAKAMRELADALDWAASQAETGVLRERTETLRSFAAVPFARLPAAVAKRLLSRLVGELGVSLEAAHLDAAVRLAAGPARGTRALSLPGLTARREYDEIILCIPGRERSTAAFDATPTSLGGEQCILRTWQPGDRMRPARLAGRSRKLSDLFGDAKVPRRLRAQARVLVRARDGEILWAEHLGSAAGVNARVALTGEDPAANNDGCSVDASRAAFLPATTTSEIRLDTETMVVAGRGSMG